MRNLYSYTARRMLLRVVLMVRVASLSNRRRPGQSCGLLDKKSLEVPGVRDFAWSPSDTVISYWVPEVNYGETPARVTLLKIPR